MKMLSEQEIINKIILGDCKEVLKQIPSNSIDVGVTSPPYNKGENKKGWLVKNVKYNGVTDKVPEEKYQQEQIEILNELYRIIKPGGSFFYNHKIRWERGMMLHPMDWLRSTHWHIRQEIIWDRMIAANIRGWRFWQTDERIYWLYKPKDNNLIGEELKAKHALLTSIWRFPPERENEHPAPFPLSLPVRCIYSIMDENKGIVIDPYSGSGTTLLAAKLLGHSYIGIEISEEYHKMALKRLENYLSEIKLFNDEYSKHVVNKTFKERKMNGEFTGKYGKRADIESQASLFD
ncbi:MAG: site-specific DNA-methyltransferase [Bacteroidota bacterium]